MISGLTAIGTKECPIEAQVIGDGMVPNGAGRHSDFQRSAAAV